MIRHALKITGASPPVAKEKAVLHAEKRNCARVTIRVPVSCVSIDDKDRPYDQNKGIVTNVSKTGIKIQAENDVRSDRLRITLTAHDQKIAEITGKVVFSQKNAAGNFKIGLQLKGNKPEVTQFVSRLVRYYHYTKKRTSMG